MLPQNVNSTFLIATLLLGLTACGGGGSGEGDPTFSDPANKEGVPKEDQVVIKIEMSNSVTKQLSSTVTSVEPIAVRAVFKDGNRSPISGKIVNFSSSLGLLDSETGDVLTDQEGAAFLELSVSDTLPGSAGALTVSYLEEVEEVFFDVGLSPVTVGSRSEGEFLEGVIGSLASTIPTNGETLLSLDVIDSQGLSIARDFSPSFTSQCVELEPPQASIGRVSHSATGEILVVYTDLGCQGQDIISAKFVDLPGHTATQEISISPPSAASIGYTGSDHTSLSLRGSGSATNPDSTSVSFTVIDSNGDPGANVQVEFSLSNTVGGASLASPFGMSNSEGEVKALFRSGNTPTVVRVTATIREQDIQITAISEDIAVSSGRPDQNSFSLAASIMNPGGDFSDGISTSISISAADRFNSSVPDGTTVFFLTEFGKIDARCSTSNGTCIVTWTSQEPRKPLFTSFQDDDGVAAFVRTIFNTNCRNNSRQPRGLPCPTPLGQPVGARSTVMAYTSGDEDFIDANANGLYDSGESFRDLPEAFLDHNEDGAFGNNTSQGSCYPNCPEAGGDEETFVDVNIDGVYNAGNSIYNGSLCSAQAFSEGTCIYDAIAVSDSVTILMSGSDPYGVFYGSTSVSASPRASVSVGSVDTSLVFYAADMYNGKLPNGTTIEIASSNCPLRDSPTTSIINTNVPGPSALSFTIKGGTSNEPLDGEITATISVPLSSGISRAESITIPCYVDACSVMPAPAFCDDEEGGGG